MEDKMTIQVTARNQDDAVEVAEKEAQDRGYNRASIKKTVSITYEVELYDPIKKEPSESTQPQE